MCVFASTLAAKRAAIIDVASQSGMTPLHLACLGGRDDCATLLLDCGASIDLLTKDGSTAVAIAVANGHASTAMLLIARRADCHMPDRATQRTPLHWAVVSGFLDCIIQLLERTGTVSERVSRLLLIRKIVISFNNLFLKYTINFLKF